MKSKVWFAVPVPVLLVLISHHANSETKPVPTVFTGKVIGITDGDTVKVLCDRRSKYDCLVLMPQKWTSPSESNQSGLSRS